MILVHLIEDAARQASLADDFIWMAGLRDIVLEAGVEEFLNPRISQILNFEKLFMSDMQF